MRSYRESCLIGSIDWDPRTKYGALNTTPSWKARLDRIWKFFCLSLIVPVPIDASENERYWWEYTHIKEALLAGVIGIAAVGVYLWILCAFA